MSRKRNGGEKFCHKTLESYKHVLDSMVNFLGASGALIRQRIESGQISSSIDCEAECLACSPDKMCQECSNKPKQQTQQPGDKMPPRECAADCAAGKIVARQQSQGTTSTSSTLVDKSEGNSQEAQGAVEEPAQGAVEEPAQIVVEEPKPTESTSEQVTTLGGKNSSLCVCAQIRKIRETASKLGVQPNESKSFDDKSFGRKCVCKGKGQSRSGNLCACPPSPKEKTELESLIVDRLNTVSKLVDLVRIDLTNLSGKSKSAALYKEIMKEGSPLAVPLGNTPPLRTGPRYPLTSTPLEPGNLPVRRRLFDDPGVSPVTANERDFARRTPTPASLFSSDWTTEGGTSSNPQPLPFDQFANFVQCIFQKKRQRPNFTEPPMPSHNYARYRNHPVGPPGPAYQSARPAGPPICTRGDPELGFGNLQRQPARNLADSQQYRQIPAQMQFYRSTSANRPQSSGVSGGSSRDPRNFENLQRARANFPALSNIAGVSTTSSGGVRHTDGDRYGDLQGARNRFCPVADVCAEMYSESGLQPVQTTSNYTVSYQDLCSDNNCDNNECVGR